MTMGSESEQNCEGKSNKSGFSKQTKKRNKTLSKIDKNSFGNSNFLKIPHN